MTGDIEDLPVIIVLSIDGRDEKAQGPGGVTGKLIPKGVLIRIGRAIVTGQGYTMIVAYGDIGLFEYQCTTDREGGCGRLTQYGTGSSQSPALSLCQKG